MNREEIDWIVQNLFVGNKLSAGELASFDGKHRIDIRNIRSPIIVFASWGDNITPPQQALDWIPDLYRSVDDIRLNEQTIVYCLHEKAGHLGLFVSAGVARRETSELASALDLIDTLPPGLYEAIIQDTQPEMPGRQYVEGRYLIQFVPRTIEDILALDDGRKDERAFEVVERVSQINQGLYDTFVSPFVKAMSNEATASAMRWMNPVRMEHAFFSDLNPWMWWVKATAEAVRANRRPAATDNPLLALEREAVRAHRAIARPVPRAARRPRRARRSRRSTSRPALALAVGVDPEAPGRRGPADRTWEREELAHLKRKELEASLESGTPVDAWARLLLYVRRDGHPIDERPFNMVRRMIDELKPENIPSLAGAEGGGQAAGVRAGAGRGARDRRAAEAGARPGDAAAGLRRRPNGRERARRADAAAERALPQGGVPRRGARRRGAASRVSHEKYQRLIDAAKALPPVVTAVAHPCSANALAAAVDAARQGLIRAILVGPRARRSRRSPRNRRSISRPASWSTRRTATPPPPQAVQLVAQGKAEALMKGSLHTDELMGAVVKRDTGLRTARRISHCFVVDVPSHPDTLILSDAAVNIAPTLEDKIDIVQNAIDLAKALRFPEARVAILSAVETVNPKIPSTIEAAALCKMADRGQITGGVLDGPLALDNAISLEAAAIKQIVVARRGPRQRADRARPRGRRTCWSRACRCSPTRTAPASCWARASRSS